MDLYFNLKLLKSPTSPFVIVAGGADADGNGVIDQASEVSAFKRGTGHAWTHTQTVSAQTKGMLFAVVFTVGAYDLVAMAFRSFGVELDADLAEWRKRHSPN